MKWGNITEARLSRSFAVLRLQRNGRIQRDHEFREGFCFLPSFPPGYSGAPCQDDGNGPAEREKECNAEEKEGCCRVKPLRW